MGWGPAPNLRYAKAANLVLGAAGLSMITLAILADAAWAHRHFLPTWKWSWQFQSDFLLVVRCIVLMAGLALICVARPRLVGSIQAGHGRENLVIGGITAIAVIAAFATAEGVLRTRGWRSAHEKWGPKEPLNLPDPILGWTLAPSHAGSAMIQGRKIYYATNAQGYRVRSAADKLDFNRPTILFAGESIMLGYGLEWRESIPAQVQEISGVQTANLAVEAYATDQSYLRLRREISRFGNPVAVIILFMPKLLDRNLDVDRPHLDEQLNWHRAQPPALRLVELTRRVTRYRSSSAIRRGIAMTQAVFRAAVDLARSKHAQPIIVVPQFLPEERSEAEIRHEVLDAGRLTYLLIPLDRSWRIPADGHPDARAARAMAQNIFQHLRGKIPDPGRRNTAIVQSGIFSPLQSK